MMEQEKIVAAIVEAAGGKLIGRVRLQKAVYLLEEIGLQCGFEYEYYHYGPYSRELDNATIFASAFNYIEEAYEHRKSDGAIYSVFKVKGSLQYDLDKEFGTLGLSVEKVIDLLNKCNSTNVTVLELAATAHWLWTYESFKNDWMTEIVRRKGTKASSDRLKKAINLLEDLGLTPPSQTIV